MPSAKPSWFANINPNVFISTVSIIAIFLALVIFAPDAFSLLTQQLNQWITTSFSWFYVLSVAIFLILLIYIALSDMGKIKLNLTIVSLNIKIPPGLRCYSPQGWGLA